MTREEAIALLKAEHGISTKQAEEFLDAAFENDEELGVSTRQNLRRVFNEGQKGSPGIGERLSGGLSWLRDAAIEAGEMVAPSGIGGGDEGRQAAADVLNKESSAVESDDPELDETNRIREEQGLDPIESMEEMTAVPDPSTGGWGANQAFSEIFAPAGATESDRLLTQQASTILAAQGGPQPGETEAEALERIKNELPQASTGYQTLAETFPTNEIWSIGELNRLKTEDPEKYEAMLADVEQSGIIQSLTMARDDKGAQLRGSSLIRAAMQLGNDQQFRNRDQREGMFKDVMAQLTTGMSGMDEMMAGYGLEGEAALEFGQDFLGYQAEEFELDMSGGGVGPTGPGRTPAQFMMERLPFDGMTTTEAQAAFNRMSNQEMAGVQMLMMEMGLYKGGPPPSLGRFQMGVDNTAFLNMMHAFQAQPHRRPTEIVKNMVETNYDSMLREQGDFVENDLNGDGLPDNIFSVASRETLGGVVQNTVEQLTGRSKVDDGFKSSIVSKAMRQEENYLRAMNGAFISNRLAGGVTSANDVDLFLAAISGQESGGNYEAFNADSGASGKYQFMPATWQHWAAQSGLGRNAAMSPDNQEHVARAMATKYYNDYGSWYDAAIAWYMGPGKVGNTTAQGAPQGGYPTGIRYGKDILGRMHEISKTNLSDYSAQAGVGVRVGDDGFTFVESFDRNAAIENMVTAQDKAGQQSWNYHQNGRAFIGMLGSTI